MLAIIPCAGFGTRMGMKPNESKEMLLDPHNKRKYIIDYSLDLCKAFHFEPLILLRKEKSDLKQHLFINNIKYIEVDHNGEWPETVLLSKPYWQEDNILILPDTRFKSLRVLDEIKSGLKLGNNAIMALHQVNDPQNWGIIKDYTIYEKPKNLIGLQNAWGLIGFKNTYGQELFSNIKCLKLNNVGFSYLSEFKDITRIKK